MKVSRYENQLDPFVVVLLYVVSAVGLVVFATHFYSFDVAVLALTALLVGGTLLWAGAKIRRGEGLTFPVVGAVLFALPAGSLLTGSVYLSSAVTLLLVVAAGTLLALVVLVGLRFVA